MSGRLLVQVQVKNCLVSSQVTLRRSAAGCCNRFGVLSIQQPRLCSCAVQYNRQRTAANNAMLQTVHVPYLTVMLRRPSRSTAASSRATAAAMRTSYVAGNVAPGGEVRKTRVFHGSSPRPCIKLNFI